MTKNKRKELITRLPILLAQIKAGQKSYILKNETILKLYFLYLLIMEENIIVIRGPKTFCLSFDYSKDIDENLKHHIEFIIKSNEYLAENLIKNEIEK